MSFQQLSKKVIDEVARYINIANKHYNPAVPFRMPRVLFNTRGTTAGTANIARWEVNFNAVLLTENGQDFIDRTVPHEVAHLIDIGHVQKLNGGDVPRIVFTRSGKIRRAKREVHGPSFRAVMAVFGAKDDTRCHNYDVTNARVRNVNRVEYNCKCRKWDLGPKHHAAVQRGNPRKLHCRKCKHVFTVSDRVIEPNARPVIKPFVSNYSWPVAADAPPAPPKVAQSDSGSKMSRAIDLVRANPQMSRVDMINLLVCRLGMSQAGAQTYYYTAKKRIAEGS